MSSNNDNSLFKFYNRGDLTAILKSDIRISYKELFDQAHLIAANLLKNKIKKNNYIPILIDDNLNFIKTTIALWFLGAIPVPVNSRLLDEEINSIVEDHNFKFLITDKMISANSVLNKLEIISINNILLDTKISGDYNFPGLYDEAVVIFTSGSSGRPKGVVHTFESLINNIENGKSILETYEDDQWLASIPFYHIGGFQIFCRSLLFGCSLILPESQIYNHLMKAINEFNPTHISLVSAQLDKFINQKIIPPKSLKLSLIGGGFIDDDLIIKAADFGWKPIRSYGSSETGSFITAITANEIKNKPQSVGKPLKNNKIKITEDSEILISSNSLFKNYLNNKKETSITLINNWFHSGDIGYLDDDGFLFIEARRNDLVVTGGENVNPVEVENALLELPFISEACVFAKQDKTWGEIVCAVIVADKMVNQKNIKDHLKIKLAGYKIPKELFFIDSLPRTSLGKLEREKIKSMF